LVPLLPASAVAHGRDLLIVRLEGSYLKLPAAPLGW
jgi:hypothetical protein